MVIPVEPFLKKSVHGKINNSSKPLDMDTDFLKQIEEDNIVLKDKAAIHKSMHGWPNPVRRTAATRKIVGSNPTPCSFEPFLEKSVHGKKNILEKKSTEEKPLRENEFIEKDLFEDFITPIEPEFNLKVDFEIPEPFRKALPERKNEPFRKEFTEKENLKKEERENK